MDDKTVVTALAWYFAIQCPQCAGFGWIMPWQTLGPHGQLMSDGPTQPCPTCSPLRAALAAVDAEVTSAED